MTEPLVSLEGFSIERILSDDSSTKSVALLGRYANRDGEAVVLLAKQHFELERLQAVSSTTRLEQQFANDVYHKFSGRGSEEAGCVNVDIIWPASEKHIARYSKQRYIIIEETPELYQAIVEPHIKSLPLSRIQWVYNILDKKAERERIVFEDSTQEKGFILLPDMKWDQSQVESMYLQAIAVRRDIRSIRDLNRGHLPLLEHIRDTCKTEVSKKYGIDAGQIRMWVHYHPSYYHFHVHIAHTAWNGPSLAVGKAILLNDIIENLHTYGHTYYRNRTLTYSLGENEELQKILAEKTDSN